MNADDLLVALHERGVGIKPEGAAIRFVGPEGAMTGELAAALSRHKELILAVFATLRKRQYGEAWEAIRAWVTDGQPGPVPAAIIAAGKRVHLPYGANEWPPGYRDRLAMALRVRALLRVLNNEPAAEIPETTNAA